MNLLPVKDSSEQETPEPLYFMDEQKIHVAELNETELTDITAGCTSILCLADHSDESDMEETHLRFIFTELTSSNH